MNYFKHPSVVYYVARNSTGDMIKRKEDLTENASNQFMKHERTHKPFSVVPNVTRISYCY